MQAVTCLDRNYSPFLNECSWQLAMQWSLVVAASDERIHPGMFTKKHIRTKGKGQGSVWILSWSRKACTILAVWEPAPFCLSSHHCLARLLISVPWDFHQAQWDERLSLMDMRGCSSTSEYRSATWWHWWKKSFIHHFFCILKPLGCKCSKLNLFWGFFCSVNK